jgi:MFS family permease
MEKKGILGLGKNWPIVLVAFYGCCVHAGCLIYGFSLFVNPLQDSFGWDRATIMFAFTIQCIMLGLGSFVVGKLVSTIGARKVINTGAFLSALGFLVLPFMKSPLHFYTLNMLVGLGASAMGPVSCSVVVTEAYTEKRGLAIGIMSTGIGVGGFVLSPLIGGVFIPNFGWQGAYVAVALVTLAMIPLTMGFIKKKETTALDAVVADDTTEQKTISAKEHLLSLQFVFISLGFFLLLFGLLGPLQSQVPHFRDIGFPLLTASTALGALGLVSAVAKLVFGILCDRYHPRYVFVVAAMFSIAGIFMLQNITAESSPLLIWAYALVFGVGVGSWLPMMSMMVSTTFGIATYSVVFGAVSMIQQIGSATGPYAAGLIYDITGSYHHAFQLAMGLLVISVVLILLSGVRTKRKVPFQFQKRQEALTLR